jgi:hypothetical protein
LQRGLAPALLLLDRQQQRGAERTH